MEPCTISITFTDAHLTAAGPPTPSPDSVVIFHDPEEDGTFVSLTTTLTDPAPSPYTVEAQITSTSFVGAGVQFVEVPMLSAPAMALFIALLLSAVGVATLRRGQMR